MKKLTAFTSNLKMLGGLPAAANPFGTPFSLYYSALLNVMLFLGPAVAGIPFVKPKETLTGHDGTLCRFFSLSFFVLTLVPVGPVWSLARGEELLFSSSSDMTVKIWDLKTLRAKTLTGHTDIIHCVAATPDDKMVISGSDDRTIRLWDTEQLKLIKSIEDDNIACSLKVAHGHLFSGSFKSVKVWYFNSLFFQILMKSPAGG